MIFHHNFLDEMSQYEALAQSVVEKLCSMLNSFPQRRITLAVPGGKSPYRFLKILSNKEIDWERVDITLVDDRWVNFDDEDSNARLISELLICNCAEKATFIPLVDHNYSPEEKADLLNQSKRPAQPDIAILGMGEDGHIASLFADAPEWKNAINTSLRWIVIHPNIAKHTRISLSLNALLNTKYLFLQIQGNVKREVLVCAQQMSNESAISKLITQASHDLHVYSSV